MLLVLLAALGGLLAWRPSRTASALTMNVHRIADTPIMVLGDGGC